MKLWLIAKFLLSSVRYDFFFLKDVSEIPPLCLNFPPITSFNLKHIFSGLTETASYNLQYKFREGYIVRAPR